MATYRNWERGKTNPVRYDNVYRLARALGVPTVAFFPALEVWYETGSGVRLGMKELVTA